MFDRIKWWCSAGRYVIFFNYNLKKKKKKSVDIDIYRDMNQITRNYYFANLCLCRMLFLYTDFFSYKQTDDFTCLYNHPVPLHFTYNQSINQILFV